MAKKLSGAGEACAVKIGELSPAVMKKIREVAESYGERALKAGDTAELKSEAQKRILEEFGEEYANFTHKELSKQNANKIITERVAAIENDFGDSPDVGIQSMLVGSFVNRQGARAGVGNDIDARHARLTTGLVKKLKAKELLDVANRGKFDIEIREAMFYLDKGMESPGHLSREAVETAKIFREQLDLGIAEANEAGAFIRNRSGIRMDETDYMKLRKVPGVDAPSGDKAHFEAWSKFIEDKIDETETFGNTPVADRKKFLATIYAQLSEGQQFTHLAKDILGDRGIVFKDFKSYHEYLKKFGLDGNFSAQMYYRLGNYARIGAINYKFGSNSKANVKSIINSLKENALERGEPAKAAKIEKALDKFERVWWPQLSGENNVSINPNATKVHDVWRGIERAGDLASAGLHFSSDFGNSASVLRHFTDGTTKTHFQGLIDVASKFFQNIKKPTELDIDRAFEMGIVLDTAAPFKNRWEAGDFRPGQFLKLTDSLFDLGMIPKTTEAIRRSQTEIYASRLGKIKDLSLDKVPEGFKRSFKQAGITEKEWDMIRQHGIKGDRDGRPMAYISGIDAIPKDVASRREVLNARTKFQNLLTDFIHQSLNEPDAFVRSYLQGGQKRGTLEREIRQSFASYKSFAASMTAYRGGRTLHSHHADPVSNSQAMIRFFTDGTSEQRADVFASIGIGVTTGYVSLMLSSIARGKSPEVPENPEQAAKLVMKSLQASGVAGLIGDLLPGQGRVAYGRSIWDSVLGPTAGRISDVAKIMEDLANLDPKAMDYYNLAMDNTPVLSTLQKHFLTRAAVDALINESIKEKMSPGYKDRRRRRLKEETGQEFLF